VSSSEPGPTAIEPASVAADVQRAVGDDTFDSSRILSVYLYGSVLWGGFDPRTSDVDLIVVAADDPPVVESYEQVRRFARAMPGTYRVDISTSLLDQVGRRVPCRPYILQAAADHGWLVVGRPTLPTSVPLDGSELVDAIDFELRQLSRSHAGLEDRCWEEIIRRQIKAHFLRISQLLHSRRPEIPFVPRFERAVAQAVSWFPSLAGYEELFTAAVDTSGRRGTLDGMMQTLVHLRDAVRHVDAAIGIVAVGPDG
jgi:hypothetical protein